MKNNFGLKILRVAMILLGIACAVPAHAQFEVEDIPLEKVETLNLPAQTINTHSSMLYEYQNYLHDIKEDIVESESYETLVDTYKTISEGLTVAKETYALYENAMSAPKILYNALNSEVLAYKSLATVNGDTYALTQPLVDLINLGSPNVLSQYAASNPSPVTYNPSAIASVNSDTQKFLQSLSTNISTRDVMLPAALQRASDVQAHTTSDQKDLKTLESQTLTTDATEHTELATLQRINKLLILLVRAQQDANAMASINSMAATMKDKQSLDSAKAGAYTGLYVQQGSTDLSTFLSGGSSALTVAP